MKGFDTKIIKPLSVAIFFGGLFWVGAVPARTSGLLYSQSSDGQSTFGPSETWTPASVNSEVADDFNVIANIDRVVASGFIRARSIPLSVTNLSKTGYTFDASGSVLMRSITK